MAIIPSLDLNDFKSDNPETKANFVITLGDAYSEIGFVAIKNHGLSDELRDNLYEKVKIFFELPMETKQKYENEELAGQRGYTGIGKEHAKGRTVGDLKEFYQYGQLVEGETAKNLNYPENIWVEELPELRTLVEKTYKTLEETGKYMLRAIAIYLGLEETYFDEKIHHGNSILRTIHYFPIENTDEIEEGAVRSAEHGDINLITLLMGASAEGLQVLNKENQWVGITALPEQIVVNIGDMIQRLTNNKLKSTIHRVVNPSLEKLKKPRYSIPFFLHPISEMDLTCLDSCIDENNPKSYQDATAGEFLKERLREIGLIK